LENDFQQKEKNENFNIYEDIEEKHGVQKEIPSKKEYGLVPDFTL